MKKDFLSYFKKYKSIIMSIAGAICLGGAVLLLENMLLAGIFSILGLILSLCGGRYANSRYDIVLNGILLWIGHSLRFCQLFGTEIAYALLCSLAFIPYCILIVAVLFLDRSLRKSGHPFLSSLILPVTYSLCTFILATLNFGFISNLMSYIMCIPVIAANLSILGEYGLTFVLSLILIWFSETLLESQNKIKMIFAISSLIMTITLLISGLILRKQWESPNYTLKVALATSQEMDFIGENGKFYTKEEQLDLFVSEMKQAAEDDVKLLILNEEYFFFKEENLEKMLDEISQVISKYKIPTLIAVEVECEDEPNINEAIYLDANGKILYTYIKNNLVPFIETGYYVDGIDEPAIIETIIDGHNVNLAFIICYDVNDEAYLEKIPSSTELLLVPSWDWSKENLEQKRTAIRSASLGLTLVKHSFDGFSHVSCPNGDCIEEIDFRGCYETVKTVSVPIWEK